MIGVRKNIKTISIFNNFSNGFEERREEVKRLMRRYGFRSSPNGDAVVVIGGDGTFLGAIKEKNKNENSPLYIGVNNGNLGFFYEYSTEELEMVFRMLSSGNYKVESYPIYEAEILLDDDSVQKEEFVNDLVVERGTEKVIHLNMKINFDFSSKFSGDGIIVSTSLGSSAYNHGVGGAVFLNDLDALQITPISPISNKIYDSLHHSLVVDDNNHVVIEDADFKKRAIRVVSDGSTVPIKKGIKNVKIKRSLKSLKLIRSETFSKMNHINGKLF